MTGSAGAPPPPGGGYGEGPPPGPGPYGAAPPPPPNVWPGTYPEASQATLALVLGIIGIVGCGLASPFAWWIGQGEVRAIDEGRRSPENRGTGNAGRVLGIVGTAFVLIMVVAVVIGAVLLVALGTTSA